MSTSGGVVLTSFAIAARVSSLVCHATRSMAVSCLRRLMASAAPIRAIRRRTVDAMRCRMAGVATAEVPSTSAQLAIADPFVAIVRLVRSVIVDADLAAFEDLIAVGEPRAALTALASITTPRAGDLVRHRSDARCRCSFQHDISTPQISGSRTSAPKSHPHSVGLAPGNSFDNSILRWRLYGSRRDRRRGTRDG